MPETLEEKFTRADRDMIIVLNTKVDGLINAVEDIKNNTVNRVAQLEIGKANQKDLGDIFNL